MDWRLFAALAAVFASACVFLAVYRLGASDQLDKRLAATELQADRLDAELACRSRVARAGTVASLDLTAATGRGLAVAMAELLEDDELVLLVTAELGGADDAELREQLQLVLDASARAEAAREERLDSETRCRSEARELFPSGG